MKFPANGVYAGETGLTRGRGGAGGAAWMTVRMTVVAGSLLWVEEHPLASALSTSETRTAAMTSLRFIPRKVLLRRRIRSRTRCRRGRRRNGEGRGRGR